MMQKILLSLVITSCLITPVFSKNVRTASIFVKEVTWTIDEEYDRYKKRGDDFFAQGDYANALKQYRNCLEVPNFENDTYVKGRIALVTKLSTLRENASKLLNSGKGEEAVEALKQILVENPNEPIAKGMLAEFWTDKATKLYAQKNYVEAKKNYQVALQYVTKPDLIQVQIQNCDEFIKAQQRSETFVQNAVEKPKEAAPVQNPVNIAKTQEKPSLETSKNKVKKETTPPMTLKSTSSPKRRIVPKVLTALVGLGAGGYAYLLNNQYQTKLNKLNSISQTTDPDGDNVILNQTAFNQWETAYKDVKNFQSNKTTMYACLGIAGAAAITEIILLETKPKTKKQTGLKLNPSNQTIGLALQYRF